MKTQKIIIILLLLIVAIYAVRDMAGKNKETIETTADINKSTEQVGETPKKPATDNTTWVSCPIKITGGISGSSYSEIFKLSITNISSKDIDSVKLMFSFNHSNYNNAKEQITSFFTLDTIWAGEKISKTVSASGYNFQYASIYPVCIYFKDGTVWGKSSATRNEIINNSVAFEIKHFGLS